MRRGLASLIMGLSLLVATASWAGFVTSRTVLDPGRSERLADVLLDDPEIRATVVDRLADAAEAQIPTDVPVTRDVIEAAADDALDDPRVEELIRQGLVEAHQNALNGIDEPVMLDGAALGAAGRDAVVARQPELDPFLPPAPTLEVELPSTGLAWLGTVKRYVDRYTLFGAVLAISGVSAAFVLARNRAAALRRVAFWAIGASAFWIAAAYAMPWVLERIAPSSVAIASAAIDVFFGAMIRPAVALIGVGVGLLLLSFAWPAIERRRPAAMLDRAAPVHPGGSWTPVASAASVAAQPPVDLRRQVPPQPPAADPATAWVPASAQPAPLDATAQFPQVWSNVDRAPASPSAAGAAASQFDGPDRASVPQPATQLANPAGVDHLRVSAPPTQVAQAHVAAPPPADQAPIPSSGNRAPATQIARSAAHSHGGAATPAPATQIASPADLAPSSPGGQRATGQSGRHQPSAPPTFHVDADAAADADDFGAEWVEGVGYVEGDSAR
jgi:hypothetical protein